MDESTVTQLLALLDSQFSQLNDTMAQLKHQVTELTHENNRLRMANAQLESVVTEASEPLVATDEVDSPQDQDAPAPPARGQQAGKARLATFYQEGIHICHPFFGMKRESGEECMFCQGILDSFKPNPD